MSKLYCTDCGKEVLSIFKKEQPEWFDSYFCSVCEGSIAREKDGRFVIWNGYEYKQYTKPDNVELGKSAKITGVEL